MTLHKSCTMLSDTVKCDMNKIENIIRHSSVLVSGKKTVRELSVEYSASIGGKSEDWIRQNKNLCGLFGSPDKIVPLYTEFNIPSKLVLEANDIFFKNLECR